LPINAIKATALASGWNVEEVDGHDINSLIEKLKKDGPLLVLADTIKGKGVSFMEGDPKWHAKWPNKEEEAKIREELC